MERAPSPIRPNHFSRWGRTSAAYGRFQSLLERGQMMSAAIGERISLAFRMKPDQQPPIASVDSGVYR
jgi:hypothetical protein